MASAVTDIDFEELITHTVIKGNASNNSISIETKQMIASDDLLDYMKRNFAIENNATLVDDEEEQLEDEDDDDDDDESDYDDERHAPTAESDPEYSPTRNLTAVADGNKRPRRQKAVARLLHSEQDDSQSDSSDAEWNKHSSSPSKKRKKAVASSGASGDGGAEQTTFECDECGKICANQRGLLIHKSAHRRQKNK